MKRAAAGLLVALSLFFIVEIALRLGLGPPPTVGVYASEGDDRWIAIACESDEQRAALSSLTGGLDQQSIEAWASARTDAEAEEALQAAGIAAHRVADSPSMVEDPQLVERGHFVTVPHASLNAVVVEGPKYRLSRTPSAVGAAPTLGQHTTEILTDILGYGEERMISLLNSGAME